MTPDFSSYAGCFYFDSLILFLFLFLAYPTIFFDSDHKNTPSPSFLILANFFLITQTKKHNFSSYFIAHHISDCPTDWHNWCTFLLIIWYHYCHFFCYYFLFLLSFAFSVVTFMLLFHFLLIIYYIVTTFKKYICYLICIYDLLFIVYSINPLQYLFHYRSHPCCCAE